MRGFLYLWRDLGKQPWYKKPLTTRLFTHLLISCNHSKGYKVFFKGKETILEPGQYWTTRRRLAVETGMSEMSIRTSLTNLQKTNTITSSGDTLGTIITINNWLVWQWPTNETTNEKPTPIPRLSHAYPYNNTITKELKNKSDTKAPPPKRVKEAPGNAEVVRILAEFHNGFKKHAGHTYEVVAPGKDKSMIAKLLKTQDPDKILAKLNAWWRDSWAKDAGYPLQAFIGSYSQIKPKTVAVRKADGHFGSTKSN